MPISPITQAIQTDATDKPITNRPPAPQPKPQPAPTDTVTLSAAVQVRQELSETAVQTAKEASQGDIQAKNLLAREAAERKAGI